MTGTPCEVPVPKKVTFMETKLRFFPAFAYRSDEKNPDEARMASSGNNYYEGLERFFPRILSGRFLLPDCLTEAGYMHCSMFHTKARDPCCSVVRSSSRKASNTGSTFSSSTMASMEVFIEGHA